MTISGTIGRNLDIGELCEEAYEQAGFEMRSGYDLRTARRSLDLLTIEWSNRGLNMWTTEELYVTNRYDTGAALTTNFLESSVSGYQVELGTMSLFDVILRINDGTTATQQDYILSRISQPTYSNIPNKLTEARPLQYYFRRVEIQDTAASTDQYGEIILWPIPDVDSTYKLKYWRARRIDDVGILASNTMQIPDRFLPALAANLAYKIALKKDAPVQKLQLLKIEAEGTYISAAEEDREKTSARFVPDMTGGYSSG